LVAASAGAQTIKSLGYNTTNGNIVAATNVTFTNSVGFATNARAATRTNLGGTTVGNAVFTATNAAAARTAISAAAADGFGVVSNAYKAGILVDFTDGAFGADALSYADGVWAVSNPTNFRTAIGLGATNNVRFDSLLLGGTTNTLGVYDFYAPLAKFDEVEIGGHGLAIDENGNLTLYTSLYFNNTTNAATTRTNLGLGATNAVTFSNITATGTLAVSNTATFSTNVTVNGSLSVGSFTTTTPSTWALDATQTAAATNGVLTLPSNANVIRLTNNNAISSVANGVLGAFYYLVNQATNAVTISNVGGIVVDGAQNLTLSPNESATLVATGPTNVSVAAPGDLTDVALGGTANTAPSQTASSGSSLMTRDLGDDRYLGEMFSAAPMDYYGPTPTIVNFREARVVQYTNAQGQGPFMWALLDPNKYAGKTVRVVAYCRVNSTNGGIVAGLGRVHYLTNISGGSLYPDFLFSPGGDGVAFGVLPESPTQYNDFNVGNSTNSYVVMTNNSGTIPTNAKLIGISFGFDRSLTNNTFTNNLYLQAVQVVVE
jgi:hypothetical protein